MIPKFEDAVATEWLYNEFVNEYELRVRFIAIFKKIVPGYFFEKARESVRKECVEELRRQVHKCSEETCHFTDSGTWGYSYVCSECGAMSDADVNHGEFNYCPNCGRRVVDA